MKQLTKEQIKQIKILQNEYRRASKQEQKTLKLNNINDKILSLMFFELMSEKLTVNLTKELYTKVNGRETWQILVNKFMMLGV